MIKFFLFSLLWMLTGNPIIAIIVLLIVYYFIDRRYVGLLPSISGPFKRMSRASNLRRILSMNPHDMSAKYELARLLMERKQFRQALKLLDSMSPSMQEEAYVRADKGVCQLELGKLDEGENLIVEAMSRDPGTHYGEPYLRLAAALTATNPEQSLSYLEKFQERNVSSCESLYRLGYLQHQLQQTSNAKAAFQECITTYRTLPKFRKRQERRWVLFAMFRNLTL